MEEEIIKSDKKKYWLKLDKNFLKSSQMKVIRSMPNGKDYIIFYLALMLESIETVGHLRFTSLVPYNDEMLSAVTDTNVDIVRNAVKIFCELGLMKIFDDGTIFLPEVPSITGKESESAERVRNYRKRLKEKEDLLMLQCNTEVTNSNDNKEKDKEEDKYKEIYKEVIEYLNDVLGTSYKPSTKSTKDCIKARLNEGYTLEDFKTVIDNKTNEWAGTQMEQYLRPITLFSNKFESYLNAPAKKGVKENGVNKKSNGSEFAEFI
jgi:uncharacterized phage protein (TIGR02220 family)/predicted phage replisome organizer